MENFFYTNRNHPDLDTLVTFVTNNYNLFIDSKIIDNNGVDVTNKYMDYQTELQQSADALTKGLTMGSRRNLMNVRKKYASEILPIAQLIEKRD